ncbi:MAG: hypothetical protein JSV51_04155 [Candidatus Bathyarchaeota archaeon]|nr:MAG: hypothetical protein JSV51_04155 [Candidatus Bathyarchaeota archaeon]
MKTRMILTTILTLFLATLLFAVFSPRGTAYTEEDPFVTDLIAGQTMDVGDVTVWNDGSFLYVRYETTGDWVMGLTHLHVATDLADIPTSKKGIPIPGQFEHATTHDPPVTEFTYCIYINGLTSETELYIAAHAEVCGPGEEPMFAQGLLATVPIYTWSAGWNVGTVKVAIVGENLVVTFETIGTWTMLDTHLYLGDTPPTYPPPWESFPYKHEGLGGVTNDTYTIPLADLGVACWDTLYVSAHANLAGEGLGGWPIYRHGWAELNPTLNGGWKKYFTVIIPCEMICETAWGSGIRFVESHWSMYFIYTPD